MSRLSTPTTYAAMIAAVCLACLTGCSKRQDVKVTATPIKILRETPGHGQEARAGDLVTISYRMSLPDGRHVLKHDEYRFEVGAKPSPTVIEGIDDAVLGMRVRGRRTIDCPPNKHWGRGGYADVIPPNTNLTIEVELLEVG